MEPHDAEFKRSILDYLVHHPGAKDTQEGVLNWWIAEPRLDEGSERVALGALEELVARGWVVKRETSSLPIYSLNQAHLDEIRTFLTQDGTET
ncbi:MAG: hypothetical protein R3B37_14255 [Nitrospira sp.]|nr:hypothetical protein [Nitrospira sp.]